MARSIYHRENSYKNNLQKLNEANIGNENRELILKFQKHLFTSGSKEQRVCKLTTQLRIICLMLTENGLLVTLATMDKDNLIALVAKISTLGKISENTKADYRRVIRQFYNWYEEEDPRLSEGSKQLYQTQKFYRYVSKNVKIGYKEKYADPATILTDSDIRSVIEEGHVCHRDKAFIAMLHETGARIGEFVEIRIRDIEFSDMHAKVHLPDGKTGRRMVYITTSIPYLRKYLQSHPFADQGDSYLWLNQATNHKDKPLMHRSAYMILSRVFEKSKCNKQHNPHWFRKSRATILAPKLTESLLCKYMGWTTGSKQVKRYVHLCVAQLEDAFMKINGLKETVQPAEEFVVCHCGEKNHPEERYCMRCSRPLHASVIIQDKEKVDQTANDTIEVLMKMMKNKKFMEEFDRYKKTSHDLGSSG